MPIRYKVIELSELFSNQKIKDLKINTTDAVNQFHSALDLYCKKVGCKGATPDKPKPAPATATISKTEELGGTGGSPFDYQINSSVTTMNAVKFLVRHGTNIDRLQILLSDGVKEMYTTAQGGSGGSPS